eukprot:gene13183-12961_t
MFLLISKRLHGKKMGMDFFAVGNLLLGLAYVLQLVEGGPAWSVMSVVNHTLTLASPIAYGLGVMRFFGYPAPLLRPLMAFAIAYTALQVLVQWSLGPVARYALLSGMSALLFLMMALTALYGVRTFAKHLYWEMAFFALLIGGICVLNAIKFVKVLDGGLEALHMGSHFQMVFYIYMSSLATVVPPSIVWLVLRRLTDDLSSMAARDPMTQLLNRRVRRGDLTARIGGEEFVAICTGSDGTGVLQLAERVRKAVENQTIEISGADEPLRCTVTIGISGDFASLPALDGAMRAADAALYRGKAAGRNR